MGDTRLWQGGWLLICLITSCQIPAAPHRTSAPDTTPPSIVVPDQTDEQTTTKIASLIRDVVQRMHNDGVTAANVATRSTTAYSNPFVQVDAEGRIHADITVTRVTPEAMADLRALQVQQIRSHASQMIIQGWVPFDRVAMVAALPFVQYIRSPHYAMRR